jgi:hypothetical protein
LRSRAGLRRMGWLFCRIGNTRSASVVSTRIRAYRGTPLAKASIAPPAPQCDRNQPVACQQDQVQTWEQVCRRRKRTLWFRINCWGDQVVSKPSPDALTRSDKLAGRMARGEAWLKIWRWGWSSRKMQKKVICNSRMGTSSQSTHL